MIDMNNTGMKRAALINDLSCMGKCSLSVALPIISACGAEAVPLPTAVLSTHTAVDFGSYVMRDMTKDMEAIIAHWKTLGLKFDCIYTGFFASLEQIETAGQFIRDFGSEKCLVIVDPVLGDNGELYGCFDDSFVSAMRQLCNLADVITPNMTEAALLTGCPADTPAWELMAELDTENVIITGVRRGADVGYIARFGAETMEIYKPHVDMMLHGTGDVFCSAFCGETLRGRSMPAALEAAADFCDECIKETIKRRPSHWYGLAFEEILRRRLFDNEQRNNRKGSVPVVRKPSGAEKHKH